MMHTGDPPCERNKAAARGAERARAAPAKLSRGSDLERADFSDFICNSVAMQRLIERARRAAECALPVLIEGEPGTGKRLLATAIHAASPQARKPLRIVHCGAIDVELFDAELFGQESGASTGRTRAGQVDDAGGGTLVLDAVEELSLMAQAKLLRALEEREVPNTGPLGQRKLDVRIIATTDRNLLTEVREGRFREALFFRLAVLVLKVPPLRERRDDIGPMIRQLLERMGDRGSGEQGRRIKKLSPGARSLLLRHSWPGNVRELQNTLQRAVVWSDGDMIEVQDIREALALHIRIGRDDMVLDRPLEQGLDLKGLLATVAQHYLRRAMEAANGNRTKAAALVGLDRQTLTNWLERYPVR